jgi:hypothetical protein
VAQGEGLLHSLEKIFKKNLLGKIGVLQPPAVTASLDEGGDVGRYDLQPGFRITIGFIVAGGFLFSPAATAFSGDH